MENQTRPRSTSATAQVSPEQMARVHETVSQAKEAAQQRQTGPATPRQSRAETIAGLMAPGVEHASTKDQATKTREWLAETSARFDAEFKGPDFHSLSAAGMARLRSLDRETLHDVFRHLADEGGRPSACSVVCRTAIAALEFDRAIEESPESIATFVSVLANSRHGEGMASALDTRRFQNLLKRDPSCSEHVVDLLQLGDLCAESELVLLMDPAVVLQRSDYFAGMRFSHDPSASGKADFDAFSAALVSAARMRGSEADLARCVDILLSLGSSEPLIEAAWSLRDHVDLRSLAKVLVAGPPPEGMADYVAARLAENRPGDQAADVQGLIRDLTRSRRARSEQYAPVWNALIQKTYDLPDLKTKMD